MSVIHTWVKSMYWNKVICLSEEAIHEHIRLFIKSRIF